MVKEIPLQNGLVALVDDEDFDRVNGINWCVTGVTKTNFNVESTMNFNGKRVHVSLQRYLLEPPADGFFVIFKDNNPLNCQKNNLMIADSRAKVIKARGRRNSSSKYKGVSWYKKSNKWVARIKVDGKDKHLGYFASEEEAALAYNKAVMQLWSGNGYLNVIGEDNNAIEVEVERNVRVKRKPNRQSTSEYLGVHWNSRRSKWIATIVKDKKSNWLGQFNSEEEAAKAYDRKALELHGDKAILNFPNEI